MNICMDCIGLTHLMQTACGDYSYALLTQLLADFPQPRYHLLWQGGQALIETRRHHRLQYHSQGFQREKSDFVGISDLLREGNIRIFHAPNNGFSIPQKKHCTYFASVQDLSPITLPEICDEKYREKFSAIFPNVIRHCDRIWVCSERTKGDLLNTFRLEEKKISIFVPLVPKSYLQCEENQIKGQDYILYTGSVQQRNRLEKLILMFRYMIKQAPGELHLCIAGNYEEKSEEIYKSLKSLVISLGLDTSVHFLGKVPYAMMPTLLGRARCVVNLSSYEGFPHAVFTAVGCRTPVVLADTDFFREVMGEAGVYVQASELEKIAQTILELCYESSERRRVLKNQQGRREQILQDQRNVLIRAYEEFL